VRIIRRLFAEERVDFAGEHYRVAGQRLFPRPEKAPPILIGGNGRSLLRLAGREADIVGFTGLGKTLADGQRHEPAGFSAERVDERVALVKEAAAARFADLELNCLVQRVVVTNDRSAEAERLATALPPLSAGDVLASAYLLLGTPAQMAESLVERRERWGMTYLSTFAGSMDAMARVISAVK
jgi:alkanesulfonate monooxygenase SsuD/methylene tetrahydromethanopterin reductase-like flavin-dependent oxidoreductase (luciferase family)